MIGISVSSFPASPLAGMHRPDALSLPATARAEEAGVSSRPAPVHDMPRHGNKAHPASLLNADNLLQAQAQNSTAKPDGRSKPGDTPKPGELTEAEEKTVKELKVQDAEVRRHEEAHARAAGSYGSAPSYQFQRGPDGGQYAIGGKVSIDVSPIAGDPEATIRKMEVVKRAASAPAEPSGADRAVAAQANATAQAARAEITRMRKEEQQAMHQKPGLDQTGPEEIGNIDGDVDQSGPGLYGLSEFARSAQAYQSAAALQPAS
jgi:hypothetical protein